jgi:hypothetical protein
MRYSIFIALLGVSLSAQNQQPNCTGIALDVDARCACVKYPNGDACKLVKAGLYDPERMKIKPLNPGWGGTATPSATPARTNGAQPGAPARPQKARVVPLAHKDYLRFLPPDAQLVAGIDFGKVFQSPDLMAALFANGEGEDARNKAMGALKEMDHLWISFLAPNDVVVVMTGKFEQGVAAGMFYSQGIYPAFLGDAHAMMVGSEPSIQAALARLAKPASTNGGWAARRAREMSKDHETWIVTEPPAGASRGTGVLSSIRQFALGFKLAGEGSLDGEVVASNDAEAEKISAWIAQAKAAIREKTGVGALDALTIERSGSSLRFAAKGEELLAGDAGKKAVSSDFGVELYSILMSEFPGMPTRTVAEDKLLAVKKGMKREEVLSLLGPPLSVAAIQGLDTPRETWTYQVPFGKQLTVRLDDGVVTAAPRY